MTAAASRAAPLDARSSDSSSRHAHGAAPPQVIDRAAPPALLTKQRPDGHWVGELQGDTILESEFILLMAFLGRESEDKRAARPPTTCSRNRRPTAAGAIYPGGPVDISVSVKAYFALKLDRP